MDDHIDIVFDGPPAQEMPRLVEVDSGSSSPSCSLIQHVWFTPKNGNAGELCTTEKKCQIRK